MARFLILSAAEVKRLGKLDDNIDTNLIVPAIEEAQDMEIIDIIGSGLFNEIKSQITTSTVSSANQTLLDEYIQPALIHWTKCFGLPEWHYKYKNKGVVTQNSDNSQSAELRTIQWLMEKAREKAQMYSQRITDFLEENYQDYPLYKNPGTGKDVKYPTDNNYTNGLYLGGDDCERKGFKY